MPLNRYILFFSFHPHRTEQPHVWVPRRYPTGCHPDRPKETSTAARTAPPRAPSLQSSPSCLLKLFCFT
jgi:hypothetical protein